MSIELIETFKKRALEDGFREAIVDDIIKNTFKTITARLDEVPKYQEKLRRDIISIALHVAWIRKKLR